jgi:TonB family protein
MSKQVTRILFAVLFASWMITTASGQSNLAAKANGLQPTTASSNETDRVRDGLLGPVRRIRTEVVKLSTTGGKTVEDDKRVLLETAEYDLKGSKTQNQYFPVAGSTLTGREVYKYDDKGNISEMTLVNPDGSLVSKEVYKYDGDSVGNWVKMTTSVAVVENGRVAFEPTEVTYRTIFYYLDATMARMIEPAGNSASAPVSSVKTDEAGSQSKPVLPNSKDVKPAANPNASANHAEGEKVAATLPVPTSSLDKLKLSAAEPVTADFRSAALDANKKVVVVSDNAPPPAPRPLLKPVSGGVLNGMALSLPSPNYPDAARRMRTSGMVQVEVVVDENGKVISARALSGPSTLRDVAVQAAYRARFSPTKLSGQPLKVTGQINYNFTMPQ